LNGDAAKDLPVKVHPEIQSTAELRRRLIPAMATNALVASFGEPLNTNTLADGSIIWRYALVLHFINTPPYFQAATAVMLLGTLENEYESVFMKWST
jgi:hypothetical protein